MITKIKYFILCFLILIIKYNYAFKINFPPIEEKKYKYQFPYINRNIINKNYEFRNFIIFGDSLSDVGSLTRENRFLAGGFDNKSYTELLTKYFTGKDTASAFDKENIIFGGSNYAVSGSFIINKTKHYKVTLHKEINAYLSDNNNKVNPQDILLLWIGAMDITKEATSDLKSFYNYIYHRDSIKFTVAPLALAKEINRLFDHGAKYVMSANIPDSAYSPISAVTYTDFTNSLFSNIPIINNIASLYFEKRRAQVDSFLRNPKNRAHINEDKGREYIYQNNLLGMQYYYFFLPKNFVKYLYDFAFTMQSNLTSLFNDNLKKDVERINKPIVFLDINSLYYELIDEPENYGIDDIISPTCTLGYSSRLCDIDSPKYHRDKNYLAGDWFHPSPLLHLIIAEYIISIFDAPLYVSSIIKHQKSINDMRTSFLQNQLDISKNNVPSINKLIPFLGYTASFNLKEKTYLENKSNFIQNINLGVFYYLGTNNLIGSMLSLGYGKSKPHHNFNYNYNNQAISLFAQNKLHNNFWINTDINIARLSLSNITRSISLAKGKNIEQASTLGYNYGLNFLAGSDFKPLSFIIYSPIMGFSLNRYYLKSYQEHNNLSTSMHFKPQIFNFNYFKVGGKLKFINKSGLNAGLEISLNKNLKNKPIIINGAVKSTNTYFSREYTYNKIWLDAKFDLGIDITKNTKIFSYLSYSGRPKHKAQNINFSIGLTSSF